MKVARFEIGQCVKFAPSEAWARNEPDGTFEIIRCLPFEGIAFEYRLKSVADGHERVAREGRLMSVDR
jgi:hypothetical protein